MTDTERDEFLKWVKSVQHTFSKYNEGKHKRLGLFLDPESASEAYKTFAKLHHGEFANV